MVDFKYKVTDIAKDFGISTKKVIETFAELTGETRKTGAIFEENEVNALLEALTRETAVQAQGEYLASGKDPPPVKQAPKQTEATPAETRSEKRVTMQELASETGIKEPVATEQVKVDRAQVSVDTRTVDVNVDKFSARYDDLADSRNMPSKR